MVSIEKAVFVAGQPLVFDPENGYSGGAFHARAKLIFSLIDTMIGRALACETMEGMSTDISSGPTTAFYTCIQKATQTFLQNTALSELKTAISM